MNTRPAPKCRWIIITELGVDQPLLGTSFGYGTGVSAGIDKPEFSTRAMTVIGLLKTRGPDRAVGGLIGWEWGDNDERLPTRAEVRYRKWRGGTALDLGAGLLRKRLPYSAAYQVAYSKGVTLATGFDHRLIGLEARVDLLYGADHVSSAAFVGARTTSIAAPAAALTLGALTFFWFLSAFGRGADSGP